MLDVEVESAAKHDAAVRDQQLAILLDMPLAQNGGDACPFEIQPASAIPASRAPGPTNEATFLCEIDLRLVDLVGSAHREPSTVEYADAE